MARLFTRAIRPPDDTVPNSNDPADVPPATVGPPVAQGGDPSGVVVTPSADASWSPPRIVPSAWSGWPDEWWPPAWGSGFQRLVDIAWICVDLNASALMAMSPYLVDAAPSLDVAWINNPDDTLYTSWEEFAKQAFWDYQLGETFILCTARYSDGRPARFHVVAPWYVSAEIGGDGLRRYSIGAQDVTDDLLHIRYTSRVGFAHGEGPLDAVQGRVAAAVALARYATTLASSGGIPPSILKHPEELSQDQSIALQQQWVAARMSTLGEPAVLSGGITWEPTNVSPKDMALHDLLVFNESRVAVAFQVPPFLVGLPTGADSMTYKTIQDLYEYHWRVGLRPKAQMVMSALSNWALPNNQRGGKNTRVELNRDSYVQADPYARAQTYQILAGIVDPTTGQPVMSVDEIRAAERLDNSEPVDLSAGVLK